MAFSTIFNGHSVSVSKEYFASRTCVILPLSKNRGAHYGCSVTTPHSRTRQSTARRRTALHDTALHDQAVHDNDPNRSHAQLLGGLPACGGSLLLPLGFDHRRRPPALPGGDVGSAHRSANCRIPRPNRRLGAAGSVANLSLHVESRFEHRPATAHTATSG